MEQLEREYPIFEVITSYLCMSGHHGQFKMVTFVCNIAKIKKSVSFRKYNPALFEILRHFVEHSS